MIESLSDLRQTFSPLWAYKGVKSIFFERPIIDSAFYDTDGFLLHLAAWLLQKALALALRFHQRGLVDRQAGL